ncbi:RNA polymerase sigma factor [Caulobacter sp.]|uniref:RNA polymerase sigma factor n=1 Tax=Caulobacter sp. TaxID=78 RepID=UPI003BA8A68A
MSGSPPRSPSATTVSLARLYDEKRANLVRLFAARLRSVAEAEDLVQDLFLKIQALDELEVRDDGSALLFRMANNLMLDRLRGQTRASARDERWRDSQTTTVGGDQVADSPSAEDVVAGRQRLAAMMKTLEALPPKAARAFSLHKLDGLSHAETAAAMGISRSAVEKHVSAALKALMGRLP